MPAAPVVAAVRDAVREGILQGEFTPGERLVETDLMSRFGATRFAVRAALAELCAEELIEVSPRRGARVRKVPTHEAVEVTEIRMVVGGLIAARAAERITDQQAAELAEAAALLRRAAETGAQRRYRDLEQHLHDLIRRIAAHRTADTVTETLRGRLLRHQFILSLLPTRPEASLDRHERIITAILDRDPEAAEAAMRAQIAATITALRSMRHLEPLP
ncbi:DNA-binding GntR family transcriptional regulator [Actinoplanes campanulatus]|uniref:DNA-binding GntR family transcriptional regulator n=1 Tax=Actinoplanes campanulatus TaxID=113559 RepID=A0A7W5FE75_9ACTN|nr:GntR family transcriptional regulator [Actinoplanes campanulatus]MBB3095184.1 DNA-binding GntR family transcriptional regulator [Actinoplanes campanulatus]GGN24008.1 hypothetical protein GCM10010109_39290 [Actinoplanes campanulatus]GID34788.1 hypothetical protein Aca09nite_12940 [Actinoplanes campanulatus]